MANIEISLPSAVDNAAQIREMLGFERDIFNGITLKIQKSHKDYFFIPENLKSLFQYLSDLANDSKTRALWIHIDIECCELLKEIKSEGFSLHHTASDIIVMNKWCVSNMESKLPPFAGYSVGVCGFVVNEESQQVLVIQEVFSRRQKWWKYPGGTADAGESLEEVAIRETREETGIDCNFQCLLCFRHMHNFRWGCSDLYFACLLYPKDMSPAALVPKIDPDEIAAAQWLDISAYYDSQPEDSINRYIIDCYRRFKTDGKCLQRHSVGLHTAYCAS